MNRVLEKIGGGVGGGDCGWGGGAITCFCFHVVFSTLDPLRVEKEYGISPFGGRRRLWPVPKETHRHHITHYTYTSQYTPARNIIAVWNYYCRWELLLTLGI